MNYKRLLSASFGHWAIDILNSSVPMIWTAVSAPHIFDLEVSEIALAAMIYTFAAALAQPLFGILVDKVRGRYVAAGGLLWLTFFYVIAPLMPNFPTLVACLTIGALGSAALHPAGMVTATAAGGRFPTMATSIFFVLGQIGLSLGPLIAGYVIQAFGVAGLPYIAFVIVPPVAIAMLLFLRDPIVDEHDHGHPHPHAPPAKSTSAQAARPAEATSRSFVSRGAVVVTMFILLIALKSTTQASFTTLLPKYFDDRGFLPGEYGAMIGFMTLLGAAGTFIGGFLGDRFNRRMVLFLSMTVSVPFSLALLNFTGWSYFVAAGISGLVLNIPHSIMLLMAQRLLPKQKGMIGGAVLGFMFASGALGAWISGVIANYVGLSVVLTTLATLPMLAGLCALVLPSTRGMEQAAAPVKTADAAAD
jgi:FSR family fosmidomycin resistance protein-like MFS transporter